MAKSKKSEAELYREERKKRIAQASKGGKGVVAKNSRLGVLIAKIVSVIFAVAIVALIAWYFISSLGVTEHFKTALVVSNTKISAAEFSYIYNVQYSSQVSEADKFDEQYKDYGYSYANYYGFDKSISPAEQKSTQTDDDGNYLTWDKVIEKKTVDYLQELVILYEEAKAAGLELNDEEKATIDENIESMASQAHEGSLSLNSYLRYSYGKGISESTLRKQMEREALAQRYSEEKQDSFEKEYTDDKITAEYKENRDDYDVVDLRVYSFSAKTLTQNDGETAEAFAARQKAETDNQPKLAEAMLKGITDEKTFLTLAKKANDEAKKDDAAADDAAAAATEEYDADAQTKGYNTKMSSLTSYELYYDTDIPESFKKAQEAKAAEAAKKAADADTTDVSDEATTEAESTEAPDAEEEKYSAGSWAFDDTRKAGDKTIFKSVSGENTTYLVAYVVKTQYAEEVVDVRHILFMTTQQDSTTGDYTALSDEEVAAAKKEANDTLAEWKKLSKDEQTEEKFAALANEHSDDPGSNGSGNGSEGGLYEGVGHGDMVTEFDSWIFDESRQYGDVEMIKSELGYHMMYYVGNKGPSYISEIRTTHTQDDYSSWLEEELKSDTYKTVKTQKYLDEALAKSTDLIEKNLAAAAAQNYSYQ